jgi:hypothetical protein
MPTSFLCNMHFRPQVTRAEAAARLSACLPVMSQHGLEPIGYLEPAWRTANPQILGGTSLIHLQFAKHSGDPLWGVGFTVLPAPGAEATVISMTAPAGPRELPDDPWHWLTRLAESLGDAIQAEFAQISGFRVGRGQSSGIGSPPLGPEVAPGHPPRVVCPWMYWRQSRMDGDGVREGLGRLSEVAFRSSPSPRDGWLFQARKDYSSKPPDAVLAAYAAVFQMPSVEWIAIP